MVQAQPNATEDSGTLAREQDGAGLAVSDAGAARARARDDRDLALEAVRHRALCVGHVRGRRAIAPDEALKAYLHLGVLRRTEPDLRLVTEALD